MANNWAIVVGINQYNFLPDATLKFAVADALAMRSFLCEEAGFKSENVLFCGDGTTEATRPMLRDILLHQIARARGADNLWFFFSGHGIADHLMTIDGNPRDLAETAVSIHFVTDCLRRCEAKNVVLILDMCRHENHDAGRKSVESIEASLRELVKQREGQQGIITLFSCGRGESSYEIAELGQGAFTYALLEGLRSQPIVKDLESYLIERVPELNARSGKVRKQVPLVIPEPGWKYDELILSNCATEFDISYLQTIAEKEELNEHFDEAKKLYRQVAELASGQTKRRDALDALDRIERKKSRQNNSINFKESRQQYNVFLEAGSTYIAPAIPQKQTDIQYNVHLEEGATFIPQQPYEEPQISESPELEENVEAEILKPETEVMDSDPVQGNIEDPWEDTEESSGEIDFGLEDLKGEPEIINSFVSPSIPDDVCKKSTFRSSDVHIHSEFSVPKTPPISISQPKPKPFPPKSPIRFRTDSERPAVSTFSRRWMIKFFGLAGLGTVGFGISQLRSQSSKKLENFTFETVQLTSGRGVISRQSKTGKRYLEKLTDSVSLEMVQIPEGKFVMGSSSSEEDRSDNEGPQHEVNIAPFFMSKTLITQAQWDSVAKLPKVKIDLPSNPSVYKGSNRPVEMVNWWMAEEFCKRLAVVTKCEYRLPSEAEWEYACRSGVTTPFYFGQVLSVDVANYDGHHSPYGSEYGEKKAISELIKTTDVQSFPANNWGLYDMHGNVWEWCADHWSRNYETALKDSSPFLSKDPNSTRVFRGGSWNDFSVRCRSAFREHGAPSYSNGNLGLRLVCSTL